MNKILIVEDEAALSTALKDNLVAEGYAVEMATNGDDAMEHVGKNRPSLILLDLLMPKKDGFFVLEQIKRDPDLKTIPIIVLSNLGGDMKVLETETDFSAVAMYADDYFVKSQHSVDEIVVRVKEYLEGKRALKNASTKA